MKNTVDSILARCVREESGCLVWTGQIYHGYGSVSWNGARRQVHRLVYELKVGPVDGGLVLDHLCRNRACCNTEHLEPVTNAENIRRSPLVRFNNGNALKTHCAAGHAFNDENTYLRPGGGRTCRVCNRASAARTQRARIDRMIDPAVRA